MIKDKSEFHLHSQYSFNLQTLINIIDEHRNKHKGGDHKDEVLLVSSFYCQDEENGDDWNFVVDARIQPKDKSKRPDIGKQKNQELKTDNPTHMRGCPEPPGCSQ